MKKIFFIIVFTNLPLLLFSQNEANHWYFGEYAGLDFSFGSPVFDDNSAMRSFEGAATVSDSFGNLLFYANSGDVIIQGNDTIQGVVCNKLHQVMPNGLLGDTCALQTFQSCIIIPKIGDINKYYLFTLDPIYNMNKGLRYSIIDMTLDGGKGDVIQKGVPVCDSLFTGMTATIHANGIDYWLIVGRQPFNQWNNLINYYAYRISASGISSPIITPENPQNQYTGLGSYKLSPDGNLFYSNQGIYNFDKSSGLLSGYRTLGSGVYNCVEFSPNCKVLYATYTGSSAFTVNQFNLNTSNLSSSIIILDSCSINYTCPIKGGMQLGPDGKIYVSLISDSIAVINNPNELGLNCNYQPNQVSLNGRQSWWDFPNFPSNYFTNVPGSNGIKNLFSTSTSIYPNPFSSQTILRTDKILKNATLTLFNTIGQEVRQASNINGQTLTIQRDNLSSGLYYLQLIQDNQTIATDKLVITD